MADRIPGTSGDAVEAQIFGNVQTGTSRPIRRRYPIVAAKLPWATMRARRTLFVLHGETDTWWRRSLSEPVGDRTELLGRLENAVARFTRIWCCQVIVSMAAQGAYDQAGSLAKNADLPGLEAKLLTSGLTEETRLVSDLWAVSRGRLSLAEFVAVHGFHGPAEGELSSRTWREDDEPLQALVETYRTMGEDLSPATLEGHRARDRMAAKRLLADNLRGPRRAAAAALLRLAQVYVPLRQLGRATFLRAFDVARFNARAMGESLAQAGLLADADDVFFLCLEELRDLPPDVADLVSLRRARRDEYERLQLPERWQGAVEPVPAVKVETTDAIGGLGVSPGVIEGRVRVVLDAASNCLEPGEILVCRTTDPSWASYFLVASGVVIDMGGPLSHGAIVARELGIPCVINVRDATRRLQTGDLVSIDGERGTVDVLWRAAGK
jgi:pyruvate,water dikinase